MATGADWEIPATAAVGQIVGTVSPSDPDPGQPLVFAIADGADNAEFLIDPNTGVIVANRPLEQFGVEEYRLRVVVSDTGIPSQYDSTTITIRLTSENVTPPVIAREQLFQLAEHASNSTTVGTVQATDPDPGAVLQGFAITAGNEDGAFAIDSATGRITVADSTKIDYETLATRTRAKVEVTATKSDNGLTRCLVFPIRRQLAQKTRHCAAPMMGKTVATVFLILENAALPHVRKVSNSRFGLGLGFSRGDRI